MIEERKKERKDDAAGELKEVFGALSQELPALIRSIIASVFSEEAGRDMGKAAASFYRELKEAGMPEETAVKMTENYMSVFTNLGELIQMRGKGGKQERKGEEIGEEISRKIKEKMAEKHNDAADEE
jgi:3-oxoacyl-ACP reductase-like protein